MMECHDCSKNLYWKHDPDWQNKYDSAYFSPGVLDKYIRCLRCWKLEMDEKNIPYEDGVRERTAETGSKTFLKMKNKMMKAFLDRIPEKDKRRITSE